MKGERVRYSSGRMTGALTESIVSPGLQACLGSRRDLTCAPRKLAREDRENLGADINRDILLRFSRAGTEMRRCYDFGVGDQFARGVVLDRRFCSENVDARSSDSTGFKC